MNAIMTGFIYLFIYEKSASADARKEKTIGHLTRKEKQHEQPPIN